MDEQLVLTALTLKLNPHIQRAEAPGAVLVLKNIPSRKYISVTAQQWSLLRNFSNPATVPDVLRAVILNRTCLPLREYYELILKAQRAGILQVDRQTDPEVRARRWALSLNPWVPLFLAVISVIAAITALVLKPMPLPLNWPQDAINAIIGWGLLILGLSLGQALAASVLRGGGGEVYEPIFLFFRPVPFLRVNLEDTCMTSRITQTAVWSVRLMPVCATAAVLWWFRPEWGWVHVIALLVLLRPFADGSVSQLLSAICRGNVLDTQKNFAFGPNQRWKTRLRLGLSRVSAAYVIARIAWGLGWICLALFLALRLVGMKLSDVFGSGSYWRQVGGVFGVLSILAILLYLGRPIFRVLLWHTKHNFRKAKVVWARWRVNKEKPVDPDLVNRLLAESLLFRRLPPAERAELLEIAKPRVFKSWTDLHNFGDKATEVGFIVSGRVIVSRRLKSGRAERVITLIEGDVFGAHAMLDADRPEALIRSATPVVALMIPIEEFEKRVIPPVGAALANDLIQKTPFLRALPFCANWHPQAVARFAQIASVVSYSENEVIVADRQDSQQFFVVYEGRVVVKREGKVRSRLRAGAFFGEIGLLQNSAAVSDVVAKEWTRCLTISKADFLRFVTHNPIVGLQLEDISSQRLGRRIFPLATRSFDVR